MSNDQKVKQIAEEVLKHLTTSKRQDDTEYIHCIDDTPDWITDMIYKAHCDKLPNDKTYRFIYECLEMIADNDTDIDDPEFSYDIYNSDIVAWLDNNRMDYVNQYLEEYNLQDIITILQGAQVTEKEEIYQILLDTLRSRIGD